jgi:hypothetical protein
MTKVIYLRTATSDSRRERAQGTRHKTIEGILVVVSGQIASTKSVSLAAFKSFMDIMWYFSF